MTIPTGAAVRSILHRRLGKVVRGKWGRGWVAVQWEGEKVARYAMRANVIYVARRYDTAVKARDAGLIEGSTP